MSRPLHHRRAIMVGGAVVTVGLLARSLTGSAHVSMQPTVRGVLAEMPMAEGRVMPALTASIAGKGPFVFGVDTGAQGYLHITPAVAQALALKPIGSVSAADPSGRNPITINQYRVDGLRLGDLAFDGVVADALPLPAKLMLDGVLGMNLFDPFTLTLDFRRRRLGASRTPLGSADGKTILAYEAGPTIRLPLTIGGAAWPADLDTGQTHAPIVVPADWIARLPTRGAPRSAGMAHTVNQALEISRIDLAAPVRIGAVPITVTELEFPAPAPVANVGSLALQSLSVRVDRVQRRVQLSVESA